MQTMMLTVGNTHSMREQQVLLTLTLTRHAVLQHQTFMFRLLGVDDASLQALATHCPGLQHLCIGHQGAEESIYHTDDYYCKAITDAALIDLAQKCHELK